MPFCFPLLLPVHFFLFLFFCRGNLSFFFTFASLFSLCFLFFFFLFFFCFFFFFFFFFVMFYVGDGVLAVGHSC